MVRVRDNGPGPERRPDGAVGHGLAGMRERAAMAGGTLRTGTGSDRRLRGATPCLPIGGDA